MQKSYRQILRELFPTIGIFQAAITKHGTKKELAFSIGVKVNAIYDHATWLEKGRVLPMDRQVRRIEPDSATMDATIKALAMAESNRNVVKVYRVTEEYKPGQTSYDGLEFVREVGGGNWQEVARPERR